MLARVMVLLRPFLSKEVSPVTGLPLAILGQPWKSQQKLKEPSRSILKPRTHPGLLTLGLAFQMEKTEHCVVTPVVHVSVTCNQKHSD